MSTEIIGTDNVPIRLSENLIYSKVMISKCVFTWSVEKRRICRQKHGEHIRSSTCFSGHNNDLEWYIDLYPKGDFSYQSCCISVHSTVVRYRGKKPVNVEFKTSLMDDQGRLTNVQSFSINLAAYQSSISRLPENRFLLQGKLRIHCCVTMTYEESHVCCPNCSHDTSRRSEDFATLLTGKKFADVVLVTDLKQIPAHKNILASRSSVFAAMFDHEMDQKDNKVYIVDVAPEILEDLLLFMYTGRSKLVAEKNSFKWIAVAELLSAADKYDVQALKKECADSLEFNLNIKNAWEVLTLGNAHNNWMLKKLAWNFIVKSMSTLQDRLSFIAD